MKRDESNHLTLSVSDITLTTTLLLNGFSITSMNVENPSRVIFEFGNSSNLESAIEKFWEGKLAVEPRKFNYQLRELKARIQDTVAGGRI